MGKSSRSAAWYIVMATGGCSAIAGQPFLLIRGGHSRHVPELGEKTTGICRLRGLVARGSRQRERDMNDG